MSFPHDKQTFAVKQMQIEVVSIFENLLMVFHTFWIFSSTTRLELFLEGVPFLVTFVVLVEAHRRVDTSVCPDDYPS